MRCLHRVEEGCQGLEEGQDWIRLAFGEYNEAPKSLQGSGDESRTGGDAQEHASNSSKTHIGAGHRRHGSITLGAPSFERVQRSKEVQQSSNQASSGEGPCSLVLLLGSAFFRHRQHTAP